jgi:hypothetical protein
VVTHHPHGSEHLRRTPPAVLPSLVCLVPLGVVPLEPKIVLGEQLLPGLGFGEGVVGQTALQVEVGLDEGLPGLPALDLDLLYAQRPVDGLRSVRAEDPTPVGDDGPR